MHTVLPSLRSAAGLEHDAALAGQRVEGDLWLRLRLHRQDARWHGFFSGVEAFAIRADEDVTSFYLTDFLARHFDALVIRGLGIDRHPELLPLYFGNYERLIYLSQAPTSDLLARAEAAAAALRLAFMHRPVGYGDLPGALRTASNPQS